MYSKLTSILASEEKNFDSSVFYILAFDSNIVHVRHLYYFFFTYFV